MNIQLAHTLAVAARDVYSLPPAVESDVAKRLGLQRLDVLREGVEVGDIPFARWMPDGVHDYLTSCLGPKLPVALVGSDDARVVVAFRGSIPPLRMLRSANDFLHGLRDWVETNLDSELIRRGEWAGMVGRGFVGYNDHLWDRVRGLVREHLGAGRKDVFLTGHSLGGAEAMLTAERLTRDGVGVTGVYSFGAPMVGNPVFASEYPCPLYRFEYGADAVPFLPLPPGLVGAVVEGLDTVAATVSGATVELWNWFWGTEFDPNVQFVSDVHAYRAAGHRWVLDPTGLLTDEGVSWKKTALELLRGGQMAARTFETFNPFQFLKDHDADGYARRTATACESLSAPVPARPVV